MSGFTLSTDFPTASPIQPAFGGGLRDIFVTKLNTPGNTLLFSTYLGGTGDDLGSGIALDAASNAYVTGFTGSTDFPTTPGAFQTSLAGVAGGLDAFIAKISPAALTLEPASLTFAGPGRRHYQRSADCERDKRHRGGVDYRHHSGQRRLRRNGRLRYLCGDGRGLYHQCHSYAYGDGRPDRRGNYHLQCPGQPANNCSFWNRDGFFDCYFVWFARYNSGLSGAVGNL